MEKKLKLALQDLFIGDFYKGTFSNSGAYIVEGYTNLVDSDYYYSDTRRGIYSEPIQLESGVTYTLSAEKSDNCRLSVTQFTNDADWLVANNFDSVNISSGFNKYVTFTVNTDYIIFGIQVDYTYRNDGGYCDWSDIQLEVGGVATAYEPYTGIQRVDGTSVDLSNAVYDMTDYEYLEYVNSINDVTDYNSKSFTDIFGTSLYGVGRTNLISNGVMNDTDSNGIADNMVILDEPNAVYDTYTNFQSMNQTVANTTIGMTYTEPATNIFSSNNYYVSFTISNWSITGSNTFKHFLGASNFDIVETVITNTNIQEVSFVSSPLADTTLHNRLYIQSTSVSGSFDYGLYSIFDLTSLFGVGFEPNTNEVDYLLQAYKDITDNSEAVYLQNTPDQRTDDLTYIELIDVGDRDFLFDLTEAFGTSIPDMTDFYSNLVYDSVNDKYYYNTTVVDDSIIEMNCQYNVDNLMISGELLDGDVNDIPDNFVIGTNILDYGYDGGVFYFEPAGSGSSTKNNTLGNEDLLLEFGDTYYVNVLGKRVGTGLGRLQVTTRWSIQGFLQFTDNYDDVGMTFKNNQAYYEYLWFGDYDFPFRDDLFYLQDIKVLNLTSYYGRNVEPSATQLESVIDFSTWSSTYTYSDSCYMTMEQNNTPIYQYELNLDSNSSTVELVFTDTIYGIEEVLPYITVEKYDLDMNYLGVLDDVIVTNDSDVNSDGFTEHTYNFTLPSSTALEDGYIYQIKNGSGGKLLTAGYVYDTPSNDFTTGLPSHRTSLDGVGIGDSVYNSGDSYLFDSDNPSDYMYSDGEEFIVHYRYSNTELGILIFYSENTTQTVVILLEDVYNAFNDKGSMISNDGYFMISLDEGSPMLLDYLFDNGVGDYNSYIYDSITYYQGDLSGLFIDGGYADNKGVYTYAIRHGANIVAQGETPLYYFDNFNVLRLPSHLGREGNPFYAEVIQYDYLSDVYNNQYIFDSNTLVSNFDLVVQDNTTQEIQLDMFQGIGKEEGIVNYKVYRSLGDYNNGAGTSAYDVDIYDTYTLQVSKSLEETRDEFLDDLGLNNVFGKVLITVIVVAVVTIIVYIKSKNIIATLISAFLIIGLAFVLGLIEAWIILFVVMLLTMMVYFMYSRSSV